MNPIIEKLALQFAKETKTSKTKALEMAQGIVDRVSMQPGITHTVAGKSQRIRQHVESIRPLVEEGKYTFLSANIARDLGVDTVSVNNNLYALQRMGIVAPTGEVVQHSGRGKPLTVWGFC